MKNQLDYSEFIERYLDGEMGGQELVWFEKELDSNEALQKEVRLRKKVNQAIGDEHFMNYSKELEEAYAAFSNSGDNQNGKRRKYIVSGSVLISVITAFILILSLTGKQYTNQKIFERYYKPYEPGVTFRSAGGEVNSDLAMAMKYYESENYSEALKLFEKVLKTEPDRIGLNFYSGISQMEVKEYTDAGKSFDKVIQDRYNMFIEQAEWYLGLCYIITNQDTKAVNLFEKISKEKGFYSKDATKILRKIK